MILELAASLMLQTAPQAAPPTRQEDVQAEGQRAIEGMVEIFTVLGACERHFSPAQIEGVQRGLKPEPGREPNPVQVYMQAAYDKGKTDTSRSAAFCQEVMRVLAESRATNGG
jgi:hypothetical protein